VGTNSSAEPGLEARSRLIKRLASLALPKLAFSRRDKSRGLGQSPSITNQLVGVIVVSIGFPVENVACNQLGCDVNGFDFL